MPSIVEAAPAAASSCTRATIGGHRVCLKPGRKCSLKYVKTYRAHGFVCKRSSSGTRRLVRQRQVF